MLTPPGGLTIFNCSLHGGSTLQSSLVGGLSITVVTVGVPATRICKILQLAGGTALVAQYILYISELLVWAVAK